MIILVFLVIIDAIGGYYTLMHPPALPHHEGDMSEFLQLIQRSATNKGH